MTIARDAVVVSIHKSERRGAPLLPVDDAELVKGQGLVGDRRFSLSTKAKAQLTLIEEEALVDAMRLVKRELPVWVARRNIITRGVALNHLVGKRFVVGDAVVVGIELCEPCGHLRRCVGADFERALLHRGGLRAEILESGRARPGDAIAAVVV